MWSWRIGGIREAEHHDVRLTVGRCGGGHDGEADREHNGDKEDFEHGEVAKYCRRTLYTTRFYTPAVSCASTHKPILNALCLSKLDMPPLARKVNDIKLACGILSSSHYAYLVCIDDESESQELTTPTYLPVRFVNIQTDLPQMFK